MKLKSIHYIFVPILSIFVITGCGSSSSSDNQPNNRLSEEKEEVAIYIPREEFQASKELSKATNFTLLSSAKLTQTIKEDAERDTVDGKWIIYDETPAGASMEIEYDDIKKSRVMKFNSNGLQNGFVLGYWTKYGSWNNKTDKIVQWSMNYDEEYYVYIRITTPKGYRYLYYTPRDHNYGMVRYDSPHYIHHGLGRNSTDGTWRTFTRDIEADLKEFDPDNSLTSIDGFFVRGSGRIDDVILLSENETTPPVSPSVEEAIKIWLASQGFNEFKNLNFTLSTDKTRAVVSFSHFIAASESDTSHTDTVVYILDTSDVNDIKELNRNAYDSRDVRTSYTGVSIKDAKYIVETSHYGSPLGPTIIRYYYNYNTGVYVDSIDILQDFSLIQCDNEDYSILYSSGTSGAPIYSISMINMTNIEDIRHKELYSELMSDDNAKFANVDACAITDRQNTILLLDNNGDLIQDFDIN